MSKLRSRTAAVVAGAAVLVTLGATGAVAAGKIGSGQITNGSVRSVDVKDGTLGMRDLNEWTRAKVSKAGAQGERGPAGRDGVSNYSAGGTEQALLSGASLAREETCGEGRVALGGGFKIDNPDIVQVGSSMPSSWTEVDDAWYPNGWTVKFKNTGAKKTNVTTMVTCATVN
jgi:hypothetical protein